MPAKKSVMLENRQLNLSNLDKIFYTETGHTKGDMLDYYLDIGPTILRHLAERPVTLKRYPDGANGKFFYQKECPVHRPAWLPTTPVWSESNNRTTNYCLLQDMPSLIWAANLATIELHTSLSFARDLTTPTCMVFDLDPGPPAGILQCAQAALWLKEIFDHHGLLSCPKTSGSKGLQIYVPLNTPASYDLTKSFAHALARLLEKQFPEKIVSNMRKDLRPGKIFVDWSQNDEHKTTVCAYSLRAKEHPFVSTPVDWDEVKHAWRSGDSKALSFEAADVLKRVKKYGDIFAPVLSTKQHLPAFSLTTEN